MLNVIGKESRVFKFTSTTVWVSANEGSMIKRTDWPDGPVLKRGDI